MSDNYLKDPRANTVEGWIAALQLLAKYSGGGKFRPIGGAEHDVIFMSGGPEPLTHKQMSGETVCTWAEEDAENANTLEGLGFHYSNEDDCWCKFV